MNCYNHQDTVAVATCSHCGRALCKECADKYTPILCDECYRLIKEKECTDEIGLFILKVIIGFVVGAFFFHSGVKDWSLIMFFSVPFGWLSTRKTEEEKTRDAIWDASEKDGGFISMVITFCIKFFIAVLFGVPLLCFRLYRFVKAIYTLRHL